MSEEQFRAVFWLAFILGIVLAIGMMGVLDRDVSGGNGPCTADADAKYYGDGVWSCQKRSAKKD